MLMYHNQQLYHIGSPHHNGSVLETSCTVESKEQQVLPAHTDAAADSLQSTIPLVSTGEETG